MRFPAPGWYRQLPRLRIPGRSPGGETTQSCGHPEEKNSAKGRQKKGGISAPHSRLVGSGVPYLRESLAAIGFELPGVWAQ
ncbi:MAG: hypothetical protein KDM64_06675 [Verrucomicrobiae bacterium]|nr:hypothetical protein [Verrucomicrobiae bacterium]